MTGTLTPAAAAAWIDRWDAQQQAYLPDREERFIALIDAVQECAGRPDPLVLDLGCGPGSLAVRLLGRLPGAEVVAIDADPLLIALGEAVRPLAAGRFRRRGSRASRLPAVRGCRPALGRLVWRTRARAAGRHGGQHDGAALAAAGCAGGDVRRGRDRTAARRAAAQRRSPDRGRGNGTHAGQARPGPERARGTPPRSPAAGPRLRAGGMP